LLFINSDYNFLLKKNQLASIHDQDDWHSDDLGFDILFLFFLSGGGDRHNNVHAFFCDRRGLDHVGLGHVDLYLVGLSLGEMGSHTHKNLVHLHNHQNHHRQTHCQNRSSNHPSNSLILLPL
jgi:hypothetical protein